MLQAWRVEPFKGGLRYRLDEEHPAIKAVLQEAGAQVTQVRAMLRVIEETVPVQRIWLDTAEAKETPRTGSAGGTSEDVVAVLTVVYMDMVNRRGLAPPEARARLLRTEPFNSFPELVAALPDEPAAGE